MNAILIDANGYTAFKRGNADAVTIIQQAPILAFNSVVLGELLAGFAAGSRESQNRAELQEFLSSERVSVLAVDEITAKHYATVYRALRDYGRPIPTNDMWIAASAIQHGCALFTFDQHFDVVPGVHAGASPSVLFPS